MDGFQSNPQPTALLPTEPMSNPIQLTSTHALNMAKSSASKEKRPKLWSLSVPKSKPNSSLLGKMSRVAQQIPLPKTPNCLSAYAHHVAKLNPTDYTQSYPLEAKPCGSFKPIPAPFHAACFSARPPPVIPIPQPSSLPMNPSEHVVVSNIVAWTFQLLQMLYHPLLTQQ